MAITITNNLFPPIVETYQPAFLVDGGDCKINFTLSGYNTWSQIKYVQVIMRNQNTNSSVLDNTKYPNEIKTITKASVQNGVIALSTADIQGGSFNINQYYKVQLRLVGIDASDYPASGGDAAWLAANQAYFSEWSTVTLISAVSKLTISYNCFKIDGELYTLESDTLDLIATIGHEDGIDKDRVDKYNVSLKHGSTIIYSTGIMNMSGNNADQKISVPIPFRLYNTYKYILSIDIVTTRGYSETINQNFTVDISQSSYGISTITATPDMPNGGILIHVKASNQVPAGGEVTIYIRRASLRADDSALEDIYSQKFTTAGEYPELTWEDLTVESDMIYGYGAQVSQNGGNRGPLKGVEVYVAFDKVFLNAGSHQLPIKFNTTVSSFKRNVSDAKQDTVGGEYAFIRRNGNRRYRSFTFNGLITILGELLNTTVSVPTPAATVFSADGERPPEVDPIFAILPGSLISSGELGVYLWLEDVKGVTPYNDVFLERVYREKVMDYLYEDQVFLYRSATEGNMLVRLTDISLTPNEQLGRLIYSFSATVTEVAKCNIENMKFYNIYNKEG